jgi:hypothetical protein
MSLWPGTPKRTKRCRPAAFVAVTAPVLACANGPRRISVRPVKVATTTVFSTTFLNRSAALPFTRQVLDRRSAPT